MAQEAHRRCLWASTGSDPTRLPPRSPHGFRMLAHPLARGRFGRFARFYPHTPASPGACPSGRYICSGCIAGRYDGPGAFPKLDVEGSNPFARCCKPLRCGNLEFGLDKPAIMC